PYYPIPTPSAPSDSSTTSLTNNASYGNGTGPQPTPGRRATNGDFYADPDTSGGTGFRDTPVEEDTFATNWPLLATNGGITNNMLSTGTYLNCSSVLLQRLADETLPYNDLTD